MSVCSRVFALRTHRPVRMPRIIERLSDNRLISRRFLLRENYPLFQIAPPIHRLDDRDIICYPWSKPVWIAERIGCLVIAVEYIRLLEGRSALFPAVAALLRDAEMASMLREVRGSLIESEVFPQSAFGRSFESHSM